MAEYRRWAVEAMDRIEGRGKRVLFVGGTALYLKALLRGLFEGPGADPVVRGRLEGEADAQGAEHLHERLSTVDPRDRGSAPSPRPAADRPGPRGDRALRPAAQPAPGRARSPRPPEEPWSLPCERPRAELHDRINRRVTAMFDAGLVEEVRGLQSRPGL